jgi:hypothetical protein
MPANYRLKSLSAPHPDDVLARAWAWDPAGALPSLASEAKISERLEICADGEGEFRLERYSPGFVSVEESWNVRRISRQS